MAPALTSATSATATAVDGFLARARQQPAGLLIEGEAGIGKTTLLAGVADRATRAGFTVLTSHTAAGETGLAHAATADLLGAVDPDLVAALPDIQRLAADRVLQRAPGAGRPTDERVTAAALLAVIQALCAQTPVLIAVDDVQWLDTSSRMVLAFVARRLKGPVGVVATERTGPSTGERAASWLQVGTGGLTRVQVDPMSLGALHSMLAARTGRRFSRPAIVRIAEMSGGNPLYALELARATDGDPSRPGVRLPSTLAELVRLRVGGLDDDVRDVLLAAASVPLPTVDGVAATVGLTAEQATRLLEAAEVEGVVVIEGNRVRFTHPLLAGGIYDSAPPARRREFHRRLAGLNTQPELRARHLAMSATVADHATLAALDAAADSARSRGAPAAAAEFMESAIRLGGGKVSRRIRAAEHHYAAGDMTRAAILIDSVLDELTPGVLRALALNLRAGVLIFDDDYAGAVTLLEQACVNVVGHDAVHVSSLLMLAFAQGMTGAFADQRAAVARSVEIAERTGVPSLISQALAMSVWVNCQAGLGVDEDALRRAIELEPVDEDVPIPYRASAVRAITLVVAGRLEDAEQQFSDIAERCLQRGAEHDVRAVTGLLAQVAIWRGRYDEADRHATELLERARQAGGAVVIATGVSAAVAAYRGRDLQARELAHRAIELGAGQGPPTRWARAALALLDVACGEHARAVEALQPLLSLHRPAFGMELMWCWFVPDAVEALIALGRHGEAEPIIEAFESNGARLGRAWQLAVGNRCRALYSAANGDLEGALAAVERALAQHDRLAMPFEQARTRLVMGDIQRRLRRRDAAARTVRAALAQFEQLGSPLWADRARKELARINVADRSGGAALTDSEQRIAELVASGMANKEVAEALYVSVKTVETNLTRVYRKLGIRSRSQLSARLGAPPEG